MLRKVIIATPRDAPPIEAYVDLGPGRGVPRGQQLPDAYGRGQYRAVPPPAEGWTQAHRRNWARTG